MSTSFGANVKEERKDYRETTSAAAALAAAKRRATAEAAFDRIAASGRKAAAAIADFVAEVEAGRAFLVDAAAGAEAPSGTAADAGSTTSTVASARNRTASTLGTGVAAVAAASAGPAPDWAALAVATRKPELAEALKAVKDGVERALRSDEHQGFVKVGNEAVSKEKVARARDAIARDPGRLRNCVVMELEIQEEQEWDVDYAVRNAVDELGR